MGAEAAPGWGRGSSYFTLTVAFGQLPKAREKLFQGGISNKYFTSAIRIMGTFNSNPSQLPSHFSLRPPPLLPQPLAQRRVRHLQENTSKSFAGCGNNKYRRSGGGGKGGETVRLLASDVCLQFVAKNNGKKRH